MRRLVLATAMFGTGVRRAGGRLRRTCRFFAAASPTRSARPAVNWDGWYVGGQVCYGAADMDFSKASAGSLTNSSSNTVLQAPARLQLAAAAQDHTPGHRLWRLSSAATGSGTTSSSASRRTTPWQLLRRSQTGSNVARFIPPYRDGYTVDCTYMAHASMQHQGLRFASRPCRLGGRQFPALCVRRRGRWAGRHVPLGDRDSGTLSIRRHHRLAAITTPARLSRAGRNPPFRAANDFAAGLGVGLDAVCRASSCAREWEYCDSSKVDITSSTLRFGSATSSDPAVSAAAP